jgi:hypothetical protein
MGDGQGYRFIGGVGWGRGGVYSYSHIVKTVTKSVGRTRIYEYTTLPPPPPPPPPPRPIIGLATALGVSIHLTANPQQIMIHNYRVYKKKGDL